MIIVQIKLLDLFVMAELIFNLAMINWNTN